MIQTSSKFNEFSGVRRALCDLLEGLLQLRASDTVAVVHEGSAGIAVKQILSELQDTIARDRFRVAVIGEFSSGKSSLLNVLLDRLDLEGKRTDGFLPTAISPTTPVLTSLVQSETPYVRLTMDDASCVEAELEELKAYLSTPESRAKWSWQSDGERKDELCGHIREVQIGLDASLLKHGVELLDTPGLGSIYAHHGEITKTCVAGVDAALFIVATDPPMGEREMTFLQYISGYTDRLLFVQTKIDQREDEEGGEPVWRVRSKNYGSRIAEVLGETAHKIIPVSAVWAAKAARTKDEGLAAKSGFAELTGALEELLVTVRGSERSTSWARRISLMIEIMSSSLCSELGQIRSHQGSLELTITTEGEYLQWEAAIPLFQEHLRQLRTRTRSRIGDAKRQVLEAVRVDVMPLLTASKAETLARNTEKRLRLERQLVEAVQRQTTQLLDPFVTDACTDAHLAATQTLGQSLPQTFRELQGSVDVRLLLGDANVRLSLAELVTTSSETRTRRPVGFWESVKSFFGATFDETVTTHRLNKEYFEALVERAVQDSVQEVGANLENHLRAITTSIVNEMKRLERAARDRDSRAKKIREQSIEEVKRREGVVSEELKALELAKAKVASITS